MQVFSRSRPTRQSWIIPMLAILVAFAGCARTKEGTSSRTGAATQADSLAFRQATTIEDEGQRLAALQSFVKAHPRSPLSGDAYPEIVDLAGRHAPESLPAVLKQFLATDYPSPDPYNGVGWNLADAGKNLDMAVPILVKAVAKARAAGDPRNLASCLDSEAWARYRAGDAKTAVAPMEEARKLYQTPDDEIERHMALIYEGAQMPEKAQPIYIGLMSHMEDPEIRGRLTRIVSGLGGSMALVNEGIESARKAGATPCPEFTLPALAGGKPVSLADYRGKVILLNFWHYT